MLISIFVSLVISIHIYWREKLKLKYSVVYNQLEYISGMETNELLDIAKGLVSFARIDDKCI